jgi:hypothetical protein
MSAVLNVVGRPESFCGRIVALVEECVDASKTMVLFWSGVVFAILISLPLLVLVSMRSLLVTASTQRLPAYWHL